MRELWQDLCDDKPEAVLFCFIMWPIGIPMIFAVAIRAAWRKL